MRRVLVGLAVALCGAQGIAAAPERPHVVVIVADDLGYGDVGWRGSEIRTPHLDRLAAEGVRLDAHYGHPSCSPSRAALLTGRHGFRVGVPQVTTKGRHGGDLHASAVTLAELLDGAGYETACVGKWHVGGSPLDHGFEHYYGFPDTPAPRHLRPEGYGTTLLGDAAVQRVTARDPSRPLFLYLAFNAPHFPLQARPEDLAAYPDLEGKRRIYAAMVTALDAQVGRVRAALESAEMLENTVIVFQSDNGGDQRFGATNGALRGEKNTPYEGGVRLAACAWSPPRWSPRVVAEPSHTTDWLPTLAALVGAGVPAEVTGRDLTPLLTGGAAVHADGLLLAHEAHRFTAYREGPWKLIQQRKRWELFDLRGSESENMARREPGVLARLQAKLMTAVR